MRQAAVAVAGALLVLFMADARAGAVVGGELIDPATAPWFAVVDGKRGGTLVAPDRVLTAAQCVWGSDRDPPGGVQLGAAGYGVVRIAMHPGWRHRNGGNFRDDVAILQLNQSVAVQPVALGAEASATVRIIGGGAIRTSPEEWDFGIRQAFLKPVDDAACARAFRHYRGINGERFDAHRMRCAGDGRRSAAVQLGLHL